MSLKTCGLSLALIVPLAILIFAHFGDNPAATRMAAIAAMMSILWISEAIPLAATALMPLILFPLLGISSSKSVASQYMNSTVFLLIGGFMIALAMQRWNLHKRIALNVIAVFGGQPIRLTLGFMAATAFLSMWISNTATTLVMLPIALAILARFENSLSERQAKQFSIGLLLAIAYSASIGGMMTLVGTAPNLVFSRLYGVGSGGEAVGFAQWMVVGVPIGLAMLALTAVTIGVIYMRGVPASDDVDQVVAEEKSKLGSMRYEEVVVLVVFIVTAFLWMTRKGISLGGLSFSGWQTLLDGHEFIDDGTVAVTMAFLMFLIPAENGGKGVRILDESVFKQLPWGVVILFGGGFALASGFVESGLSKQVAISLSSLASTNLMTMIAVTSASMTLLTELTSNTATTQLVLPILRSLAEATSISPLWLMLPATLAASCAFMFPVATPPNAIIFGSGKLHVLDMVKTGVILNLMGILVITLATLVIAPSAFQMN